MADDMDVFEEILARLDVEDVLRFKSVCKSWYSLISSNYFVKTHLKHTCGHLRIRLHWNLMVYKCKCSEMVGSSNGLVCISPYLAEFLVINPSTREVKKLPTLPYNSRTKLCWGFGYDSSTDDYKVVVGINESEHHMRFQVLTLRSNKWKFVGDDDQNFTFTYNTSHSDPAFLYNGALHWFMDDRKKKKIVILSFDLSLEKFKEIPQPVPDDDTKYVCDNRNRLGIFEECLCIFRAVYDSFSKPCNYLQTWVMKNYNSWQLIPRDYENNKYAAATAAYTLDCVPYNTWRLCHDDKGSIDLSWQCWGNIAAPIYVKSLVSPYLYEKQEESKSG